MIVMKKKTIIILLFVALAITLITIKESYAYYVMKTNISISSTSSNVICDAEIQSVNNNEKSIFGYSEFKVVVKNYDTSNNRTAEAFDYVLTVENESGSSAIYGYNNVFDSNLSINGTMSNDTNKDDSHIIQVKSNSGLSENINYKVKVNCIQKN